MTERSGESGGTGSRRNFSDSGALSRSVAAQQSAKLTRWPPRQTRFCTSTAVSVPHPTSEEGGAARFSGSKGINVFAANRRKRAQKNRPRREAVPDGCRALRTRPGEVRFA